MIKARHPALLQEINKLQSQISTLEKDLKNMVYGQQQFVDPATVDVPPASAIQVVPKDFDQAFPREGPLLFDGIIFEAGRMRRAPVPHPDITDSSDDEIEDEANVASPDETENESNQAEEDTSAAIFEEDEPARVQEDITEELEQDAAQNSGSTEPAGTHVEFEIHRARVPDNPSRVSAVLPSQNSQISQPARLQVEDEIADEVGLVGAMSPARVPGRDVGVVVGGKGAVIDDEEEGDDPAARGEQVRREALRASVEREADQARQRRDAEWQAEQRRRQNQIEEERSAAQRASANPSQVRGGQDPGPDSQERRRLAEAVQSALPEEPAAANRANERVPPSAPAAPGVQERRSQRAEDLSRLKPGDVAAPGFVFGGKANGIPFYVCQATGQSVWELPSSTHLAAVMATLGRGRANLRPGDRVAPNYVFGGYSHGLPFYVREDNGQSVWELPVATAEGAASAGQSNAPPLGSQQDANQPNEQSQAGGANRAGAGAQAARPRAQGVQAQNNGIWGPGEGSGAPRQQSDADVSGHRAADRRSQEEIDREMAERLAAEWAAEENLRVNERVEQTETQDVQRQQEDLNWLQEQVRQQAGRPRREAQASNDHNTEKEKKKDEELKKKAEQVLIERAVKRVVVLHGQQHAFLCRCARWKRN